MNIRMQGQEGSKCLQIGEGQLEVDKVQAAAEVLCAQENFLQDETPYSQVVCT